MIAAAVVAFLVTSAVTPVLVAALRRGGVLDRPNHRSSHSVPTPRGGGVAVAGGILAGSVPHLADRLDVAVVAVAVMATLLGIVEDCRGVRPLVRLALQAAAVLPLAVLAAPASLALALTPLALFALVAGINAVNFMDGINGISSVQAGVTGALYAALAVAHDLPGLAAVAAATAAATLAFLPHNAPRARVFLGDSGSYCLGALLGGLAVALWSRGVPAAAVAGPLVIYLADTGWTLLCRYRRGEDWRAPHRDHVYQRLVDAGRSHAQVTCLVAVLVVLNAALGVLALQEAMLPAAVGAAVGSALLYLHLPGLLPRPVPRP